MTLFTIDIAFYQGGLDLAQVYREGFSAVMARCSTGYNGGSADSAFPNFRAQAKAVGGLFGGYHFLYPSYEVSIQHQADVCASALGNVASVMIDHEPDGSGAPIPSLSDALAFAKAMRQRGKLVGLEYLPHWVWQAMGSPSLAPLAAAGLELVSSNYVGAGGYAAAMYPGASGAGWASYGGLKPRLWQFTDGALVAGQRVDANAFEGSLAELTSYFTPAVTPPTPTPSNATEDTDMVIVQVDRNTVPAGTPWPGWFLLTGNGELVHIPPAQAKTNGDKSLSDNLDGLKQAGISEGGFITYSFYQQLMARQGTPAA
jgi:hypothetical protein